MIQSDIFDSSSMDIKKIGNSVLFYYKEINRNLWNNYINFGHSFTNIPYFLFARGSKFYISKNTIIKNFLGFYGSYISDLFFQSIGLIAFLIQITFFFTGINIFRKKKFYFL